MAHFSHASRLVTAGAASSALCAAAGIVAFAGPAALKISSALLVLAVVVAFVGYAYADQRGLGWGALVLVAACLPLFVALSGIGTLIMSHLGVPVAGGALIALSITVAVATATLLNRIVRLAGAVPRGAPRAPSER
jgi:hypothetical protein